MDLKTMIGWQTLVDVISVYGWRDAVEGKKRFTANQMMKRLLTQYKVENLLAGHKEDIRKVYGAAYWAATQSYEKREVNGYKQVT